MFQSPWQPQISLTKRDSMALPLHGVRDFGVELHGVELVVFVGHAGDRAGRRGRHQLEARRQRGDLVAVAHPDLEHAVAFVRREVGQAVEQLVWPCARTSA